MSTTEVTLLPIPARTTLGGQRVRRASETGLAVDARTIRVEAPKKKASARPRRRPTEDLAEIVTHAAGLVAAAGASGLVLTRLAYETSLLPFAASALYCATLVLLFLASTLFHAELQPARRALFQVVDHCAIYLFIAGTYTPFCLLGLDHSVGVPLLGAVWSAAATGIVLKLVTRKHHCSSVWHRRWCVGSYAALGWSIFLVYPTATAALPPMAWTLFLAGGLAYTLGGAFYLWHNLPYGHTVWHVFGLVGAAIHFVAIFGFL